MTTTSNSHRYGSTADCHRLPRRTMKRGGWWSQNDQHHQVKDDQRPNREEWEAMIVEDLQIMRQAHCAALLIGILLLTSQPSDGSSDCGNACGLRGLGAIGVLVEDVPSDLQQDGLTVDDLQTDVELRLRQAGIRVLTVTMRERLKIPVSPFLSVWIVSKKVSSGHYAFSISVSLMQQVHLSRNPSIEMSAMTWHAASVGYVSNPGIRRNLRQYVSDTVDRFINAYLAVNPK
jgi:hypothetical protein